LHRLVDRAALDRLAHHRRRCDADRTALAAVADVLQPAALELQLHFEIVAALRVVAARMVRGRRERAEVARRALVLDDELAVQIVARVGRAHRSLRSAVSTPSTSSRTSSSVLYSANEARVVGPTPR